MRATLQERFEAQHEAIPFSGCWIWTGALNKGYGVIGLNNKVLQAHRVSYEFHHGSIPKGHVIDHLCKMPCCVNPNHLEAVTQGENVRRGLASASITERNKALGKARTHCPTGHEYSPENTYVTREGFRVCRACNNARSNLAQKKKRISCLK